MDHVPLALDEEIALEGLDGITLESLWFRLSERLKLPLPFYDNFKRNLWRMILQKDYFEFYEIEEPRKTVGRLDRLAYVNRDEKAIEEVNNSYYIYSYHPVDDKINRGSCQEFKTRKKIERRDLVQLPLENVVEIFGDKLVIVASQKLRNTVLIPPNIGRDCDINNYAYCILERIGRSRHFGETTSGPFSLFDYVKDSKLLHYFRTCLLKNNLVLRQTFSQKINGKSNNTQLFHLPRFYIVVKPSDLVQIEKLFAFLLSKPNNIASAEEIKHHLNYKRQKSFSNLMKNRHEVFEYRKFNYRDLYPNAEKKEYCHKNGTEKTLLAIKLVNPNLDIFQLYENEDKDQLHDDENCGFLDCSNQQVKRPLVSQIVEKVVTSGSRGLSQSEIGKFFGLSKLNSRAVLRKAQKCQIQTYVRDEGRQRVTMYIDKKFANEKSKEIVDQVAKLFRKAEENYKSAIHIVPFENAENVTVEETLLVPLNENSNQSPKKVSIPLNENFNQSPKKISVPVTYPHESRTVGSKKVVSFFKQETPPSSVIQFVQPQESLTEQQFQTPYIEQYDENTNKVVLMPNDDYSFVDNVEDVKVSLRFLNNIPGLQRPARGLQEDLARNRVSEKVLTRMNFILDAIKEKTVMDPVNLLMAVRKEEVNFSEVICRKSLLSLCARLAADNFIKVIEMELTSSSKAVKLLFFGEPNITFDLRCWHSIIEEQKIHHFISLTRPIPTEEEQEDKEEERMLVPTSSFVSRTSIGCDEFGAQSPVHENFPKFMKYRLFHEFLYYLIYGYPENVEKIQVKRAIELWRRENQRLTDYDEIAEKISVCYSTDINWKMFIPPLNPQLNYHDGWGFLRDIIHRIPLILYVKFTRYGHLASEINEYLAHPIKSNYLLHFLPPKMFAQLTQGRKYVLVISELCKRLCMMGLLQFGPMRAKELDQCFIYLNKNASLLDTRSSDPGYLEVSEKEYPKVSFHFDSAEVLSNYWSSMFEICTGTRINQKSVAFGKTIILEQMNTKSDLLNALTPQTAISAPLNDTGEIPGDKKGAGGLDKAFMSHLKQSWSRSIDKKKRPISALAVVERKAKIKAKKEKIKAEPKKKKSAKLKAATKEVQKSKAILQANYKGVSAKSKIIRKVKPKKQTVKELKKKSEMYDDVDKNALKLMKTLRVTWSDVEDKTLSLAKVALKFAFPNDNQCAHYVSSALIRDVLHWRTEKALNKTSRACQRRIVYLMKNNKAFREQTILYLEELRANRELSNKYSNFAERLKKLYNQEQIYFVMKVHIVEIIHRMHQMFFKEYLTNPLDTFCNNDQIVEKLPLDYDEIASKYTIINPNNFLDDSKYHEPTSLTEIEISVLSSLLHSAICSTNDKISSSYFLHEAYMKFKDENIGAAANMLRRMTIISLSKSPRSKTADLPRTISPFHLSNRYGIQLMSVHVPVELYDEYLGAIREISCDKKYQMKTLNCGWTYMIVEFLNRKMISLVTERSDRTLKIDTQMKRKTNFEKISDNYLMLKNQKEQKSDDKKIKSVRFQPDSNSDEKFIYNDDPIEIFYKLDTIYLHIFCILQAIEHNENVGVDEWKLTESDKCSLKNCVIRSGDNFSIETQRIACHSYEIIRFILNKSDEGPSKYDENLITKFNLIKYFDSVIEKYTGESVNDRLKHLGKVGCIEMCQKVTTEYLLNNIQRIATEVENEDGAWLSEYKKISMRKTEEEVFYDEEDSTADQSKIIAKNQLKDISKPQDQAFVVNLSSLHILVNMENEETTIDGDEYVAAPFNEETRSKMMEEIKASVIWKPEVFLKSFSLAHQLKSSNKNSSKDDMNQMELILKYLKTKKEIGSNVGDLLEKFCEKNKEQVAKYINTLIDLKFVLKTGVNEIRFVHKDFASFWLIETFYLTANDSDDVPEPPLKKIKTENTDERPHTAERAVNQSAINDQPGESMEDLEKNQIRNPYLLYPCPWTRVGPLNRTLNRRCFDKWLGSVLNYLSVNPGMLLTDLCSKFNVLTPVHIRNLCEVLELIGCIKLMASPELKVNVFSEYDSQEDDVKPATYLDTFDHTFIEVNPDAIYRLSFFIGKKKYKLPFI